jgi:hypothetical protein
MIGLDFVQEALKLGGFPKQDYVASWAESKTEIRLRERSRIGRDDCKKVTVEE